MCARGLRPRWSGASLTSVRLCLACRYPTYSRDWLPKGTGYLQKQGQSQARGFTVRAFLPRPRPTSGWVARARACAERECARAGAPIERSVYAFLWRVYLHAAYRYTLYIVSRPRVNIATSNYKPLTAACWGRRVSVPVDPTDRDPPGAASRASAAACQVGSSRARRPRARCLHRGVGGDGCC